MPGYLGLVVLLMLLAGIAGCVLAVLAYRRGNEALRQLRELDAALESLGGIVHDTVRKMKRLESAGAAISASPDEGRAVPASTGARETAAATQKAAVILAGTPADVASPSTRLVPAEASMARGADAPPTARAIPAPEPAAAVQRRAGGGDTLEAQIGGKWFLFVGAAVFVLGIGFFVKYAFDNHWINETARVVIGGLVGLGMIGSGAWFIRRGYDLYGQILAGAGFVAIFISLYAAYAFYGLIDRTPAFLMFAVTAAASAASADSFASPGLGLMAIIGGFITPFLVGGDVDSQVTLLSYDALLVAGTMFLAHRRAWPLLNIASFAFTGLTFFAWAQRWYAPSKYLPTEAFLVLFCAMFLYVLRENQRRNDAIAQLTSKVLWAGPAIFHLASLNNLFRHSEAYLLYLTVASAVTVAAATRFSRPWVRLAAWLACVLPFLAWFADHTQPEWRVAGVTVLLALYGIHLLAQIERLTRRGEEPDLIEILIFHANGLGLFAGLYTLVDKTLPSQTAVLALVLALWSGALAAISRRFSREAPAQGLALAFGMAGFAIGLQFDDRWATVGWAAEATAIIWTGLIIRREWMRVCGALVLGLALVRLFSLRFFETPAGFTAVMNPRVGSTLVIVALLYLLAFVHRASADDLEDRAATEIAVLVLAANITTLMLVSVEIASYFNVRAPEAATADLARGMTLSLAWGLYGIALVVAGITLRYRPIRYLAILVLAGTAGKVLMVDLSELGGVYRITGFIGMGVLLLLGSYLYQRFKSVIVGDKG